MITQLCQALAARGRGLWEYLMKREERRQAVETCRENRLRDVELENARNAGTREIVEALAQGGEVLEIEPDGRSRWVRMPERARPPVRYSVIVERVEAGESDDHTYGELTP